MMVEGILLIDKPRDWTSFDVVAKVRRLTGQRRTGHGGTLDPMATGVLPVFLGRATKIIDLMDDHDKRYTASVQLGISTDTQDTTGTVLQQRDASGISLAKLEEVFATLTGDILQIPPMYSAVQVDGVRLYKLARQGVEVERPARPTHVEFIRILEHKPEEHALTIDVKCSKGTYIRTIIDDAGTALGCGAAMSGLRRTEALGFGIQDCVTLEQLEQAAQQGSVQELCKGLETPFERLPALHLTGKQAKLFLNGVRLELARLPGYSAGKQRVYCDGSFAALARADEEAGVLRLMKMLSAEV